MIFIKKDVMFIDDENIKEGYIKVTGTHYGKIGIAPKNCKGDSRSYSKEYKYYI